MDRTAVNFTPSEENVLVMLVQKYQTTLECKRTGAVINNLKKDAWAKIEAEFNAQCGSTHRSIAMLQNKYINLKNRSKKKLVEEKCYKMGTGVSLTSKPIQIADVDVAIRNILGSQMTGGESNFDDDFCFEADNSIIVEEHPNLLDKSNYNDLSTNITVDATIIITAAETANLETEQVLQKSTTSTMESDDVAISHDCVEDVATTSGKKRVADWSTSTPAKLRKLKSRPLVTPSTTDHCRGPKNKILNKITSWVEAKTNSNNLKDALLMEEHQLKMKFLKEKHQQEMAFAAEEHHIEMEILRKQLNDN